MKSFLVKCVANVVLETGSGNEYHCKLLTSGVELGEMWNAGSGLIPSAVSKVVAYKYRRSLLLISSTLSSSNPVRDRDRSPEVKRLSFLVKSNILLLIASWLKKDSSSKKELSQIDGSLKWAIEFSYY